ncbi:hypothetical protein MKW98_000878 [Papaver atlanticum]|uniref:Membrane-associated kinase regulator 1 n=1 Tax=Papaver atlanticum TaxID=357466 RepID=A0AAD4XDE9_9MAGN|nr:hypothetical protein MKW98_000878 [Papaver atlanticum]
MGKSSRRSKIDERSSRTLPSSPTHSSSSSDFEFLISLPSPHKLSSSCPAAADELFFKGQILPLHISPRLSMLQSLGSSSSSSASSTTNSRDSTSSSNDLFLLSSSSHESSCNSSCRPSSVTEDLELLPQLHHPRRDLNQKKNYQQVLSFQNLHKEQIKKPVKYFSLSRFSNVFRKDQSKNKGDTVTITSITIQEQGGSHSNSVTKMKEMVSKYMKKVKPFYEKLSSKQQSSSSSSIKDRGLSQSQSFSENILYPRKNNNNHNQSCIVSSCPSSMRSSPSRCSLVKPSSSSIEELQNAIQGAITHCKNSYSKSDNQF